MAYSTQCGAGNLVVGKGLAAEMADDSPSPGNADGGAPQSHEAGAQVVGQAPPSGPARLICLVAAERADELLCLLREQFAGEPQVAVLIERRTANRAARPLGPNGQIRRRVPVAVRDPARALPPELRHQAQHLRLVQRMEPLRRTHEDADTADLVAKTLEMEPEAVSELWWRISERVLSRLRLRLGQVAAEEPVQDLLGCILDELPGYDGEQEPLTAWLDTVVDRYAEKPPRSSFNRSIQRAE